MVENDLTTNSNGNASYSTYDLFILIVSVLSLGVMTLYYLTPGTAKEKPITYALDNLFSLIFLFDFFRSLYLAHDRKRYFLPGGGWLDLLGSLPGLPILRLLRIWRMIRISRNLKGISAHQAWHNYRQDSTNSAFLTTLLATIFLLSIASLLIVRLEASAPGAEITSPSDALWWSIVTVTTVGYGDLVPVTDSGRSLAALLMTFGVALVSVLTSFITTSLVQRAKPTDDLASQLKAEINQMQSQLEHIEALLEHGNSGQKTP